MADELKSIEQQINQDLDNVQKLIETLPKKSKTKQQKVQNIDNKLKAVDEVVKYYKNEIPNLKRSNPQSVPKHNQIISEIETKIQDLQNQFQIKKKQGTEQEQLFMERKKQQQEGNIQDMSQQQLIELTHETQKKGTDIITGLISEAEKADLQIDNINQTLDEQIAQLDRMQNNVKDIQSVLKRTGKHIQFFAKNIYTDKLIMCLIFLILAAIVALTVLSAIGFGDGSFTVPDKVKQQVNQQISSLNKTVQEQLNKTNTL